MNNQQADAELAHYLTGQSNLSDLYQAQAQDEPSLEIDQAILAASRRAVKSRPRSILSPFGNHWAVPTSIAAMLVITVTLSVMMKEEIKDPLAIESPILEQTAPAPSPVPALDSAAGSVTRSAPKEAQPALEKKTKPVLAEPLPQKPLAEQLPPDTSQFNRAIKQDYSTNSAAGVATEDKVEDRKAFPASNAAPQKKETANNTEAESLAVQPNAIGSIAKSLSAKPSASAASTQKGKANQEASTGGKRERMEADTALKLTPSSPEVWLDHIRQLQAEGQWSEAEASLRRFKQYYPSYPISAELEQPIAP